MTADEITKVSKEICSKIEERIQEQKKLKEGGLDNFHLLECNSILIGLNWAKKDILDWTTNELIKLFK